MAKKEIKKSKKSAQKSSSSLAAHQEKALKEYERAVQLLQQRKFSEAGTRFEGLITAHPDEKELADRCRVYLRVCERSRKGEAGDSAQEKDFYYDGILESNRQRYDTAMESFQRALQTNPQDDRVVYLMASTLALKGERDKALTRLREAIDLNRSNRAFAQQDPDFDALREDEEFRDLVYPTPS